MPATKFICPDGNCVPIEDCLRGCPNCQRCMFLPTLRAVANSLDRQISEPTVTELIAGIRETFLKKATDYAVDPASILYAIRGQAVHSKSFPRNVSRTTSPAASSTCSAKLSTPTKASLVT